MSDPSKKKRAAPDPTPLVPYQRPAQPSNIIDNGVTDPAIHWNLGGGGDSSNLAHELDQEGQPFNFISMQPSTATNVASPSTTVMRRSTSHALIPTNPRPEFDTPLEPWTEYGEDRNAMSPQDVGGELLAQENMEALENLAQKAKLEAQSKRKQIPPFVQKLSSFLEECKNEDLIRWSEKGDSFIVMDEDEFAKTLIPELFKHNNYASFVRQLNMYGFHKRVGLSDNSMRASERKNKSPSEYYNPFFRRGHPLLLWLINKPKTGSKAKKGARSSEADGDSEEEIVNDTPTHQLSTPNPTTQRSLPAPESRQLPKKDMVNIKDELKKVREQQKMIYGAIAQLQRNNSDLYSQALMFQSQHDRHQNSINAILNFLANVFRKTLEDGSNQNVGEIISNMIKNQGNPTSHQQGNVFDLGEFVQVQVDESSSLGGTHKRARGLLPPIPRPEDPARSTRSPSGGGGSERSQSMIGNHNPEMGHITELFESETPPSLRQELASNPQERMMKIINDHNATNTSDLDIPEAAKLVANTPNSLDTEQASKLVDYMSKSSSAPSVRVSAGSTPAAAQPTNMSLRTPTPTDYAQPIHEQTVAPSLSPIMQSPVPPPSLHDISTNQIDLDQLQRLQSEQDAKIHELSEMLGPLSPLGRIPGLSEASDIFFDTSNVDMDQYFDSTAFLDDAHFGADSSDFNFNLDVGGGGPGEGGGGKQEGQESPTPATGTAAEVHRNNFGGGVPIPQRGTKRRRTGSEDVATNS